MARRLLDQTALPSDQLLRTYRVMENAMFACTCFVLLVTVFVMVKCEFDFGILVGQLILCLW